MQALRVVPAIYYFDTFKEFNDEFKLGKGDILVTNQWMYDPYVKPLGIDMPVVYQEKYGAGEPTDEMMDAMKAEMDKYEYDGQLILAVHSIRLHQFHLLHVLLYKNKLLQFYRLLLRYRLSRSFHSRHQQSVHFE